MRWLDTVKALFARDDTPQNALHHAVGEAGEVLRALRGVVDPEMDMDIVRLGLVRGVAVEGNVAHVRLTPTTAGCPLSAWLVGASVHAIEELGFEASVEVVTEPAWTPEDMDRG